MVEGTGEARIGVADLLKDSVRPASRGQKLGIVHAVTIVVGGKAHGALTNARTVGELLSAMRISPDDDDRVTPPPRTPLAGSQRVVVVQGQAVTLAGVGSAPVATEGGDVEYGQAAWYEVGGNGAAHPWLPIGTAVTVTNLATGESIVVVINDRGPFGGRIIDLSRAAFEQLAPLGQGVMDVRLTW